MRESFVQPRQKKNKQDIYYYIERPDNPNFTVYVQPGAGHGHEAVALFQRFGFEEDIEICTGEFTDGDLVDKSLQLYKNIKENNPDVVFGQSMGGLTSIGVFIAARSLGINMPKALITYGAANPAGSSITDLDSPRKGFMTKARNIIDRLRLGMDWNNNKNSDLARNLLMNGKDSPEVDYVLSNLRNENHQAIRNAASGLKSFLEGLVQSIADYEGITNEDTIQGALDSIRKALVNLDKGESISVNLLPEIILVSGGKDDAFQFSSQIQSTADLLSAELHLIEASHEGPFIRKEVAGTLLKWVGDRLSHI
jgi:hypothetical protein